MGNKFMRDFCETTSFDGFPHWYRGDRLIWKVVWAAIIVLAFAAASFEIWKVFDDFRHKPISTYYQIKQTGDGVEFPDIVLCNTNFVNSSKLKESRLPLDIVNSIVSMFPNDNRLEVLTTFFPSANILFDEQLDEKLSTLNESTISSILYSIAYDQNEFIKTCFYQRERCTAKNISVSKVRDIDYGVCFLFQVGSPQFMPKAGLSIIADVHSELWWSRAFAFTSGVALKLEKEFDPFALRLLHISSGFYSQISLSLMHRIMFDDGRNSTCTNDMSRQILNTKYSVDMCHSECFFKKVYKSCTCVPTVPRSHLLNNHIPYCLTSKHIECILKLLTSTELRASLSNCSRHCLPRCNYWTYSATVTTKKFPAAGLKPVLMNLANNSLDANRADDYLLIDISFEQIQHTEVLEQESITIEGFIGQIGGHLGLFLGASIMSIIHICVLLLQTVFNFDVKTKK